MGTDSDYPFPNLYKGGFQNIMKNNAAVYAGTRNVYSQLLPSAKSLLMRSNVNKIYFLIEDDEFPYPLPPEIECINVSNQSYFRADGPNFQSRYSYMVLLRVAYTKMFPELDRILSIDMDTIVNENISELWDLDLTNYYLAAVEEYKLTKLEGSYINMGVAMLNLKKLREDKMDDKLISLLNSQPYRYKEQDCINSTLRGQILILPSDYNACFQASPPQHEKITHFAGYYDLSKFPHFNYYKNLSWDEIMRNTQDKITLDIIIPTYKNKEGLHSTLDSISSQLEDNVNIIVVDDGSNIDYSDIIYQYPFIKFYQLTKNSGPGVTRQYGFNHSDGTYVTFLDTGDRFYEHGLKYILELINKNTYIKRYTTAFVYDKNNHLILGPENRPIGSIFKRSFIEMYNITFSTEGSYANEDYGFCRACEMIMDDNTYVGFSKQHRHTTVPVFYDHYDPNSLTKKDNEKFYHTALIPGIIINGLHAINIAKAAKVEEKIIIEEINNIMAQEYFFFLWNLQSGLEYIDDTWETIRNFYFNHYSKYEEQAINTLSEVFARSVFPRIKKYGKNWKWDGALNILRFVKELKDNLFVPDRYFT